MVIGLFLAIKNIEASDKKNKRIPFYVKSFLGNYYLFFLFINSKLNSIKSYFLYVFELKYFIF